MRKRVSENMKYWNNVFLLQKYVWKFAPELILVHIVKTICQITMNVLVYELMIKRVLDAITQNRTFGETALYVLWVGVWMFLFNLIYNFYQHYILKISRLKIHRGVHNIIFERVQGVDLECYDNSAFYNDYIWALDRADTEILNSCNNIFDLLFDCGHAAALLSLTLIYDKLLLVFVAVPMLLHVILGNHTGRITYSFEQEDNRLKRRREYARRIFYQKEYARELKLYPIGNLLRRVFRESVDKQVNLCRKYGRRLAWLGMADDSLSSLFGYTLLYIYLAYRAIVQSAYTAGTCAALVSAVGNLSYALERVFRKLPQIRQNGMYAEKILSIMNYEGAVESFISDQEPDALRSLELRNISFRYPHSKNYSIQAVSLSLKKGEKLAIVGRNGAGKTTLARLLMRYYDVEEGCILYNGRDIREFTTARYRERFSTIFQDFQMYALSIEENISAGEPEPDREQILSALRNSGLEDLSDSLSLPLTREFDEDGLVLSGGQCQKLAIARALYRGGDIVIMDEASSALDPISEAEINNTILEQMTGKSMIIISHRLSTIKHVDKICFMEQGRILEMGSHSQLMAQNGKYAEMYRIQAEQYTDRGEGVIS